MFRHLTPGAYKFFKFLQKYVKCVRELLLFYSPRRMNEEKPEHPAYFHQATGTILELKPLFTKKPVIKREIKRNRSTSLALSESHLFTHTVLTSSFIVSTHSRNTVRVISKVYKVTETSRTELLYLLKLSTAVMSVTS